MSSSVFTWPDKTAVIRALSDWAEGHGRHPPRSGFASVASAHTRGDWGVGSDLDVIIVVRESSTPFVRRGAAWDLTRLPVPADVLVYTEREWQALADSGTRFARIARDEALWVYSRPTTRL